MELLEADFQFYYVDFDFFFPKSNDSAWQGDDYRELPYQSHRKVLILSIVPVSPF